jgi:hypothetical protein
MRLDLFVTGNYRSVYYLTGPPRTLARPHFGDTCRNFASSAPAGAPYKAKPVT